jgi:hypothetical protein
VLPGKGIVDLMDKKLAEIEVENSTTLENLTTLERDIEAVELNKSI